MRQICLGVYLEQVREDPNHNYMFSWNTTTEEEEYTNLDNINTYIPPSKKEVLYPPSSKNISSTPNFNRKLKAPAAVYKSINNAVNNTVNSVVNKVTPETFDKNSQSLTPDPELEQPLLTSSDY